MNRTSLLTYFIIAAIILLGPFATILAINALFAIAIPINYQTWLAVAWLIFLAKAKR